MHAEDKHFQIGIALLENFRCFNPVHVGHADIHHDHVRLQVFDPFQDLQPIGCLADDVDALFLFQPRPDTFQDKDMVIDQHDLHYRF